MSGEASYLTEIHCWILVKHKAAIITIHWAPPLFAAPPGLSLPSWQDENRDSSLVSVFLSINQNDAFSGGLQDTGGCAGREFTEFWGVSVSEISL